MQVRSIRGQPDRSSSTTSHRDTPKPPSRWLFSWVSDYGQPGSYLPSGVLLDERAHSLGLGGVDSIDAGLHVVDRA
jgi:hypothetical protein